LDTSSFSPAASGVDCPASPITVTPSENPTSVSGVLDQITSTGRTPVSNTNPRLPPSRFNQPRYFGADPSAEVMVFNASYAGKGFKSFPRIACTPSPYLGPIASNQQMRSNP